MGETKKADLPKRSLYRGMKDHALFALNFLRRPAINASIVPSSRYAGAALIDKVDFQQIDTIVELGPGTGAFTKVVLSRCKPDAKMILIELEASYIAPLQEQFGSRVSVEHTGAHRLDSVLEKHGIEKIDLIISGLPFLPDETKGEFAESLLRQTDQGAIYRFFTYMPPIMKRVYADLPLRKKSFVPLNFPPMWIYGIN
jgi:phospholipid N-methyltransferase